MSYALDITPDYFLLRYPEIEKTSLPSVWVYAMIVLQQQNHKKPSLKHICNFFETPMTLPFHSVESSLKLPWNTLNYFWGNTLSWNNVLYFMYYHLQNSILLAHRLKWGFVFTSIKCQALPSKPTIQSKCKTTNPQYKIEIRRHQGPKITHMCPKSQILKLQFSLFFSCVGSSMWWNFTDSLTYWLTLVIFSCG